MYSDEIKSLLEKRNNLISNKEYCDAFDVKVSTQIKHIVYDDFNDLFKVNTSDGYEFEFRVYPDDKPPQKVKKCK